MAKGLAKGQIFNLELIFKIKDLTPNCLFQD